MADLAELRSLMEKAIERLLAVYLDAAHVEASFEVMGVDTQLIQDGTYFAVEHRGMIVGCGGWSRRATMFGGDHVVNRDARHLDPAADPARVRAMYTHPDFARRGIGRFVLSLCESAALREGFRSFDLVATVAGEPLYAACGYEVTERFEVPTSKGVTVPASRMSKKVAATQAMQQPIVGYHQDEEQHWVAQLACGHNQHVRHNPPWTNRPWVVTAEGREQTLGRLLNCVKCESGAPRDAQP